MNQLLDNIYNVLLDDGVYAPCLKKGECRSFLPKDLSTDQLDAINRYIGNTPIYNDNYELIIRCYCMICEHSNGKPKVLGIKTIYALCDRWVGFIKQSDINIWKRCVRYAIEFNTCVVDIVDRLRLGYDGSDDVSTVVNILDICKMSKNDKFGKLAKKISSKLLHYIEISPTERVYQEYLYWNQTDIRVRNKYVQWLVSCGDTYYSDGDVKYGNGLHAIKIYERAIDENKHISKLDRIIPTDDIKLKCTHATKLASTQMKSVHIDPIKLLRPNVGTIRSIDDYLNVYDFILHEIIYKSVSNERRTISDIVDTYIISDSGNRLAKLDKDDNSQRQAYYKCKLFETFIKAQLPAISDCYIFIQSQTIPMSYFVDVITNNPIIPANRIQSIARGLYYGYTGNLSVALHLLSPQVENIVRCVLQRENIVTTHDNIPDADMEISLSRLIDNNYEKLCDKLGVDIVFMLDSLFNNKTGRNYRNNLAHGLLDDADLDDPYMLYTWWVLLKWFHHEKYIKP